MVLIYTELALDYSLQPTSNALDLLFALALGLAILSRGRFFRDLIRVNLGTLESVNMEFRLTYSPLRTTSNLRVVGLALVRDFCLTCQFIRPSG